MVTLDEAFFSINDCNGRRSIYYKKKDMKSQNFVKMRRESFETKFMVVGAITGKGTLPLIRVPAKVKINSDYYIDHVLKPFLEEKIPKLYGRETSKVYFHHDTYVQENNDIHRGGKTKTRNNGN